MNSVYFKSDVKRLFLFKACTENEVRKSLECKELNLQELTKIIEDKFKDFEYKKIGMMAEKKEIILNFDFPQAVDCCINDIVEGFSNENGWSIKLNEKINNSATDLLIKKLIDPIKIKKISFYPEKFIVQVFLIDNHLGNGKENELFEEKAGWKLLILSERTSSSNNQQDENKLFFKVDDILMVEQNIALDIIDKAFEGEHRRPYKKV